MPGVMAGLSDTLTARRSFTFIFLFALASHIPLPPNPPCPVPAHLPASNSRSHERKISHSHMTPPPKGESEGDLGAKSAQPYGAGKSRNAPRDGSGIRCPHFLGSDSLGESWRPALTR